MVGMSDAATGNETEVTTASESRLNVEKFAEALGAEHSGFWGWTGLTNLEFNVDGEAEPRVLGDGENDVQDMMKLIGSKTPDEFMYALSASQMDEPFQELINTISADEGLKNALHLAASTDETVLTGFEGILNAEGEGALTVTDLNKALTANVMGVDMGAQIRQQLTEVLTEVGQSNDDDATFQSVLDLGQEIKDKANSLGGAGGLLAGFGEMMNQFRTNPDGVVGNLLGGMGLEGTGWGEQIAAFMSGMLQLVSSFFNTNPGGPMENYANLGRKYFGENGVLRQRGSEIFEKAAQSPSPDTSTESFDTARADTGAPENTVAQLDTRPDQPSPADIDAKVNSLAAQSTTLNGEYNALAVLEQREKLAAAETPAADVQERGLTPLDYTA